MAHSSSPDSATSPHVATPLDRAARRSHSKSIPPTARHVLTAIAIAVPPLAAFDARLWSEIAAIFGAALAIEFVLSFATGALAVAASALLALLLCAHAAIHWMPLDLGASLAACAAITLVCAYAARGRLARALVAIGASLTFFAAVELAFPPSIAFVDSHGREAHELWSADLYQPDAELGWRANRSVSVVDTSFLASGEREWTATYHTEADGGRVVPDRPASGPCMLLFGCSYAFGHGLDDELTIAAQVQRALPTERVFDYGALAYGGVQSRLALERCEQPAARCVLYLYIDDHLRRDGGDAEWLRQFPDTPLFDVDATDALVRRAVSRCETTRRRIEGSLWKRSFWFRRLAALRDAAIDEATAIAREQAVVLAMRADVERKWGSECRFAVAFLPEPDALRMPPRSRQLAERLRARGVECVDLFDAVPGRPRLDDFDRSTGHPRADWARRIANVLASRFGAPTERAH